MDWSFYHFVTKHAFDRQTDRRADRRTEFSSLDRVCIPCSAVKKQWQTLKAEPHDPTCDAPFTTVGATSKLQIP